MNLSVSPGALRGALPILPSKSQLHRLLICGALANGPTTLYAGPTEAEDVAATIDCLTALGAKITSREGGYLIIPLSRDNLPAAALLPCRESGSTFRFMLPLVCALGVSARFHLAGRLPERPLAPLEAALARHGIALSRPTADTLVTEGKLCPGDYSLPGDISSQFITGLLLALPLLAGDSTLTVEGPRESEDYIAMTLEVLERFGQRPLITQNRYEIQGGQTFQSPGAALAEGDWSNGAFWLAAGAMPGGEIQVRGLNRESRQGDREICAILARMGANIHWEGDVVTLSPGHLRGTEIDAAPIPDLIPVLAAVASVSEGDTVIKNAARLRLKESDRLRATAETLNALGARVREKSDGLEISGVPRLKGGQVDAWGDHRIAMTAAVASTVTEGPVTITGAQAVRKSYPDFWALLETLGKEVRVEEE